MEELLPYSFQVFVLWKELSGDKENEATKGKERVTVK